MDDPVDEVKPTDMVEQELPAPEAHELATTVVAHKSPRLFDFLKRKRVSVSTLLSILLAFAIGLSTGYVAWGHGSTQAETASVSGATPTGAHAYTTTVDVAALSSEVNPPAGYTLPARFDNLGPQLLAAGAIDYQNFVKIYADAGRPLSDEQTAILTKGSPQPIVIKPDNAYFLLNFFWAVGLTNRNSILLTGPMIQGGKDKVGNFASTGGWTVGTKSAVELYASAPLMTLSAAQQKLLEDVAKNVFRPCCDNPTHFPDCNHGMAMLGLLELLASQNASADEMYQAAKFANAFWYPQQSLEQAIAFKATKGLDYTQIDARELTGSRVASASGFRSLHQWLVNNGLLQQGSGGGNNCGV